MSIVPDVPALLASVVARLQAIDLTASIDPAQVVAPGVWVHWTGLDLPTLDDGWVLVELTLVVPANELNVAVPAMQDLLVPVVAEFGRPDGEIRTQNTQLPDAGAPCPSLVLPYLVA